MGKLVESSNGQMVKTVKAVEIVEVIEVFRSRGWRSAYGPEGGWKQRVTG